MNFKHILLAGAAVMTLAACSNDDVIGNGEDNNQPGSGATFEGDGYMAVSINLPTTAATGRANDDFNHGIAAEYKVNKAILILFNGSDEYAATYAEAHELKNPISTNGANGDNITTSYKYVVQLDGTNFTGENIYGLVMLNYDNVLSFDAEGALAKVGTLDIAGKTFSDVAAATNSVAANLSVADNFFMTNAPMSSTKGTLFEPAADGKVETLIKINKNAIYPSEAEAEAGDNSAATFFVERAVAKVSLVNNLAEGTVVGNLAVKSIMWTLDNTESTSYIVRNVKLATSENVYPWLAWQNKNEDNEDSWRFAGYKWMGTTSMYDAPNPYRTYWCYDPAYSAPKTITKLAEGENAKIEDTELSPISTALYCHENTFDVKHQTVANTTRAYLKVTFDVTGDLFTNNGNKKVVYDNATLAGFYAAALANTGEVKAAFKAALATETVQPNETLNGKAIEKCIVPTISPISADAVTLTGFSIDLTKADDPTVFDQNKLNAYMNREEWATEAAAAITYINRVNRFEAFTGGVAYYPVLIKHFGDDLTPWSKTGNADNVLESYGVTADYNAESATDAANIFLGRYGLVRNNWYQLSINNINQLGTPSYVGADVNGERPDDQQHEEQWINFTINVLSWAVRTQGVDLK